VKNACGFLAVKAPMHVGQALSETLTKLKKSTISGTITGKSIFFMLIVSYGNGKQDCARLSDIWSV